MQSTEHRRTPRTNYRLRELMLQLEGMDIFNLLGIAFRIASMRHKRTRWVIGLAVGLLIAGVIISQIVNNAPMSLVLGIWIGIAFILILIWFLTGRQ